MQFFFGNLQTEGIYIIIDLIPEHNKMPGCRRGKQSVGIIVGGFWRFK